MISSNLCPYQMCIVWAYSYINYGEITAVLSHCQPIAATSTSHRYIFWESPTTSSSRALLYCMPFSCFFVMTILQRCFLASGRDSFPTLSPPPRVQAGTGEPTVPFSALPLASSTQDALLVSRDITSRLETSDARLPLVPSSIRCSRCLRAARKIVVEKKTLVGARDYRLTWGS